MLEIALQMRIYFFRDMMFTDNLMTLDEIFSETNMSSPGFSSHVAAGMELPWDFWRKTALAPQAVFWGARRIVKIWLGYILRIILYYIIWLVLIWLPFFELSH